MDAIAKKVACIVAAVQNINDVSMNTTEYVQMLQVICDIAETAPEAILLFKLEAKQTSGCVFPMLVMTLVEVAEDFKRRAFDTRCKCLLALKMLIARLSIDAVKMVLPGLTSRLFAVAFSRASMERQEIIAGAIQTLFSAWRFTIFRTELFEDKWKDLIRLVRGRWKDLPNQSSLADALPSDDKVTVELMLEMQQAQRLPINFLYEYLEKEDEWQSTCMISALKYLWPTGDLPADLKRRLVRFCAAECEKTCSLITIKYEPAAWELVLAHISDASICEMLAADTTNPLSLKLLSAAFRSCMKVEGAVDILLERHGWMLMGQAEWSAELSADMARCLMHLSKPEPVLPYIFPMLLSGLHQPGPIADACTHTIDRLVLTMNASSVSELVQRHADDMLPVLSSQLICPYAYPFASRCISAIAKWVPSNCIGGLVNQMVILLEEHREEGAVMGVFLSNLLVSIRDCLKCMHTPVLPLCELDEVQGQHRQLLSAWQSIIPLAWSDMPECRQAALECIELMFSCFEPNHAAILNKLHQTWTPLIAAFKQSPSLPLARFTARLATMAPDFLASRFAKTWWPLFKSHFLRTQQPLIRDELLGVLCQIVRILKWPVESIAEVFALSNDDRLLDALEPQWPDYVWFVRHQSVLSQ